MRHIKCLMLDKTQSYILSADIHESDAKTISTADETLQ